MRRLFLSVLLASGAIGMVPRAAEAGMPTIEMRLTPPWLRPYRAPSLGALIAFPLTEHLWLGGGYELIQDYDAILWTSELEGHKPIVMSGIRAGAWYRGGAVDRGMSWAAGGLVTFANSAISIEHRPDNLNRDTSVVDVGADLSIGRVRNGLRVEVFATPAWSYGRVASPAVHKTETLSAFTYRIGVAFAILLGS
jgi:hypothetical protein